MTRRLAGDALLLVSFAQQAKDIPTAGENHAQGVIWREDDSVGERPHDIDLVLP